jgi:arylsulfatase
VIAGAWAVALMLAGVLLRAGWPDRSASAIDRVVVIHLDTTRYDDLGCNGGIARTPNIDAVATRGLRYTNAITTSPKTSPSIASFLTGRLPNRHGVYDVGSALDDTLTSVAEILQSNGYVTGGFTSNPIVGRLGADTRRAAGFDQGYDVYETHFNLGMVHAGDEPTATPRERAPLLVNRALAFVDEHRDEPFFLWMLHLDPHAPYAPAAPYDTMYLDHPLLTAASVRLEPHQIHPHARVAGRVDSHEYVARHLGEVTMLDHELGRLLRKLESLPGRTLLVITADHGESLGDDGQWFTHGLNIRAPCLHVPLIIACDGIVPVDVSGALAANVDLAPTILDLVGISSERLDADGRSLVPTFREREPWPDRMIPIQTLTGWTWRGIRSGRFSFQSRLNRETGMYAGSVLYDLASDPRETTDVADRFPKVFETHFAREKDWFLHSAYRGSDLRHDPEILRQLRSLGYVN